MHNQERNTKLDGLRGILAIIVALNHSFLAIAIPSYADVWNQNYLNLVDWQSKIQQIFMILGNGGVAVTLFFILSGLVLGHSLSRTSFSARGLLAFIIKRLIRLYPPYIFVIFLISLYMVSGFEYTVFAPASPWFNWWMNFEMNFKEFIYNFFFIHTYLGGVTWTLRVIIISSLVFPLFYLAYKKTPPIIDLFIIIFLVWSSFNLFDLPDFRDLRYLYMFYAGLTIPKFCKLFQRLPKPAISLLILPALYVMFTARYGTDEYRGGAVETLVGWFVIGTMVYSPTKIYDWLSGPFMQFFGKISYSLYLIHFSVLYIMARTMFVYLPNLPYQSHYLVIHIILFVLSLPVTTYISVLIYKHIEKPSVVLATFAGQKIKGE